MANLLLLAASGFLFYRRALRYFRFYQQEEYQTKRFLRWLVGVKGFDTKATSVLLTGALFTFVIGWPLLWSTLSSVLIAFVALTEEDPRKVGKVRLKMTERAKNIFHTTLVLAGLLTVCCLFMSLPVWATSVLLLQLCPLLLIGANLLLMPQEKKKQERFLNEAKAILAEVNPFVIGITGSYGKTSTKDALAKILQVTLGPTFWPPKSFNTPMGITREIRERLVPAYDYACIEMGAYTIGSIERLCDLTPPDAAIITGIGKCHLDRFKSVENIYLAKSELARAVPEKGILVCNGDNVGSRKIATEYCKAKTYLYGFDETQGPLDAWVSKCTVTAEGTHFTLHWQKKSYEGHTALIGKSSLSNAIAAFTMACALGADPEFALAVISTLEPVDNRLQVKKSDDVYYVHDAYNSNPAGFASALEVLQALPGKRKIVMTPGMIELGPLQHEENYQAAKQAGQFCDVALIVGNTNKASLVEGFKDGGLSAKHILLCQTRESAFDELAHMRKEGDVILIENDLTDIYEAKVKF